ncbi:MAG: RNA-binding domain-containing protein, partial [Desulfurococcaceae archaeon]
DLRGYIKLNYTWHEGYYGNPIGVVHVKINSKQQIEAVLSHIAMSLSDLEKSILKTTFDLRFDPRTSRFIIRLSKQDLYYGRFKVVDSDDIVKLVLSFRNAKRRSDVIEYLRRLNITL